MCVLKTTGEGEISKAKIFNCSLPKMHLKNLLKMQIHNLIFIQPQLFSHRVARKGKPGNSYTFG